MRAGKPAATLGTVKSGDILARCVVAMHTAASIAIGNPDISIASAAGFIDGRPCWNIFLAGNIGRRGDLSDDLSIDGRLLYNGAILVGKPEKLLSVFLD